MKRIITFLILIQSFSYAFCETKEVFVEYDISSDSYFYNEIRNKYGNLWIGYYKTDIEYIVGKDSRFVIENFKIYYCQSERYILLGEFKKDGVYDKDGKCFFPFSNLAKNIEILGYSSEILKYPLEIILVKKRNDLISEINPFGAIGIDIKNNSLYEYEIDYGE